MNIIGINGSARANGNGFNLLNTCLESFEKGENSTELIQLCDKEIQGCRSCYACKGSDTRCVVKDDMTPLYKKIIDADLIMLSSPVIMWQISSEVKAFMERLYPFFHFGNPSDLKGKKLILLFTQATPDEKLFEAYFAHIKNAMAFLGFDVIKSIVATGLREIDDYARNQELLSELKQLSSSLSI